MKVFDVKDGERILARVIADSPSDAETKLKAFQLRTGIILGIATEVVEAKPSPEGVLANCVKMKVFLITRNPKVRSRAIVVAEDQLHALAKLWEFEKSKNLICSVPLLSDISQGPVLVEEVDLSVAQVLFQDWKSDEF